MLTKSVITRATTATRAGSVMHGLGHITPFSGRGSRNAAEDPRPNTLQLNTKGLTENKISVIEQIAYKNKAFIIVLQEMHCTTADKLVTPNFSLAGSILNRNYGLATFAYERLEWSLVDQSPNQSETVWLCADVPGYKIIHVYKPPRSRFTPTPGNAILTVWERHPDIPTPHSVCWRLQLPACQLGLQPSIPWRWEPGILGKIQQPSTVVQPKGNGHILLSPLKRWHQPRSRLRAFRPGQPTAVQTCSRKVPAVTTSGETSTLSQGGQIAVVGARVKTVKYITSSCSFNLGTTFLQHSFPYKLRPHPGPPALC